MAACNQGSSEPSAPDVTSVKDASTLVEYLVKHPDTEQLPGWVRTSFPAAKVQAFEIFRTLGESSSDARDSVCTTKMNDWCYRSFDAAGPGQSLRGPSGLASFASGVPKTPTGAAGTEGPGGYRAGPDLNGEVVTLFEGLLSSVNQHLSGVASAPNPAQFAFDKYDFFLGHAFYNRPSETAGLLFHFQLYCVAEGTLATDNVGPKSCWSLYGDYAPSCTIRSPSDSDPRLQYRNVVWLEATGRFYVLDTENTRLLGLHTELGKACRNTNSSAFGQPLLDVNYFPNDPEPVELGTAAQQTRLFFGWPVGCETPGQRCP